jgi:hypothetical protein
MQLLQTNEALPITVLKPTQHLVPWQTKPELHW